MTGIFVLVLVVVVVVILLVVVNSLTVPSDDDEELAGELDTRRCQFVLIDLLLLEVDLYDRINLAW